MQQAFARCPPTSRRRDEPGSRDGFEAVTDGRYTIEPTLAQPTRGRLLQGLVYQVSVTAARPRC
jgi:hypothetical protein